MAHPLDGCRAKIKRANEHIKQISDDIVVHGKISIPAASVRASVTVEVQKRKDPSTYRRYAAFYIKGPAPLVDVSFTILAGEAIHQLRSVLDHLVYQLIILKTQKPPTFNSAFPIVGKGRTRKDVWIDAPSLYKSQTSRLTQDISVNAEALIHALQPYQRGATFSDDPLWILSELDNAYKHRLLLLTVFRVSTYRVTVTSRGKTVKATFTPNIRFEHDAEIGQLPIEDPECSIADADVTLDGKLVVEIAFKEIIDRVLALTLIH